MFPRRSEAKLEREWNVFGTSVSHHHVAPDGTEKLLLRCEDGRTIECVLMAEGDRRDDLH